MTAFPKKKREGCLISVTSEGCRMVGEVMSAEMIENKIL